MRGQSDRAKERAPVEERACHAGVVHEIDQLGRALDSDAIAVAVAVIELARDDDLAGGLLGQPPLPVPEGRRRRGADRTHVEVVLEEALDGHGVGHALQHHHDRRTSRAVHVPVAEGGAGGRVGQRGIREPAAAVVGRVLRAEQRAELDVRDLARRRASQRRRDGWAPPPPKAPGQPFGQIIGEKPEFSARYRCESRPDNRGRMRWEAAYRGEPPARRVVPLLGHGPDETVPEVRHVPSACRDIGWRHGSGGLRPRRRTERAEPLHELAHAHAEEHGREIPRDSVLTRLQVRPVTPDNVQHAVGVVPAPVEPVEPDLVALVFHALRDGVLHHRSQHGLSEVRRGPFNPGHRGKMTHGQTDSQRLCRPK